jgi:hypothetical protein
MQCVGTVVGIYYRTGAVILMCFNIEVNILQTVASIDQKLMGLRKAQEEEEFFS